MDFIGVDLNKVLAYVGIPMMIACGWYCCNSHSERRESFPPVLVRTTFSGCCSALEYVGRRIIENGKATSQPAHASSESRSLDSEE